MYRSDLTASVMKDFGPPLGQAVTNGTSAKHPPKQDFRAAVSGRLYVLKTGCP
jgi:hypothetical protein